jgi:hypothetical protein
LSCALEFPILQPDLHQNELRTGATDGSVLSILDSLMHNPAEELADAVKRFALQAARLNRSIGRSGALQLDQSAITLMTQ